MKITSTYWVCEIICAPHPPSSLHLRANGGYDDGGGGQDSNFYSACMSKRERDQEEVPLGVPPLSCSLSPVPSLSPSLSLSSLLLPINRFSLSFSGELQDKEPHAITHAAMQPRARGKWIKKVTKRESEREREEGEVAFLSSFLPSFSA